MKTAMQELILQLPNEFIFDNPIIILDALKKEKEQILNARLNGFMISAEGWNGEYPEMKYTEVIREIKNEEYYNQTYNQNK